MKVTLNLSIKFCFVFTASCFVVVFANVGVAQESQSQPLGLEFSGLRSTKGFVCYSIFAQEVGFPKDASKAERKVCEPVTGSSLKIVVSGLARATYAVAAIHDEDGNKNLAIGLFGIPKEGIAFSRNPHVRFFAPSFKDCAFEKTDKSETLTLSMKYF